MSTLLTPEELSDLQLTSPKLCLIDLRSLEEVSEGIIPGAIWMDISDREFMAKAGTLSKDVEYCLYCASGGRSAMAVSFFEMQGFSEVFELAGGASAWIESGKVLTRFPSDSSIGN